MKAFPKISFRIFNFPCYHGNTEFLGYPIFSPVFTLSLINLKMIENFISGKFLSIYELSFGYFHTLTQWLGKNFSVHVSRPN